MSKRCYRYFVNHCLSLSTLRQQGVHVESTLCPRCVKYVSTMFQYCVNNVPTLCQQCVHIPSTLCQQCVNNVSTLCQHCVHVVSNMCQHVSILCQQCVNNVLFQYLVNTVNNCRKAMTTISKMTVNSKISKTLLEIRQYSNFCSVAYRTLHKTLRGKIHLALGMVYSVKQKCKSCPSQETIGLSRITFWYSLLSGTKSLSFPTARQSL